LAAHSLKPFNQQAFVFVLGKDVEKSKGLALRLEGIKQGCRRPAGQQAARIVASGLGHEGMAADDRAYLVRMVEQRTGLAPPQAEARVSAIVAKSQEALTRARHAAVILAFMIGASLLIGAAIAWVAATGGGQHRGERGMPHFWRRWDVNRVFLIR
jgi:hypothetical protein